MVTRCSNLGTGLALLAVCLQIAVAALGGRICLRVAPLPPSEGCPSSCCDKHDTSVGESWVELDCQLSPAGPTDADCCLEVATDYLATATGIAGLRDLDASALTLPALAVHYSQVEFVIRHVRGSGPEDAKPPPAMPVIRAAILRI